MDWVRGEKLGHGSFATVNLAGPRSQNPSFPSSMAVKSCAFANSSSLMNEKSILDELIDCPEIIRCFGESCSYENGEKLYNVLMEYASGGNLADKVKNSDGQKLSEFEVRQYTKALLKGLNYIHKVGFVHCDIKLQNLLLCSNGDLKIADFGLAKRAGGKEEGSSSFELRGTPLYMSPEMLTGGDQGPPADIWALGCAVTEMISGAPAWRGTDVTGVLMRIGVGDEIPEIPGNLSAEGKDFVGRCFVKDPSKRWTAEMLLNHPFVCEDFQDFDCCTNSPSTSPRGPLDFPDWGSSSTKSIITPLPLPEYSPEPSSWFSGVRSGQSSSNSAAERMRRLVTGQAPNWSVSDEWFTVR